MPELQRETIADRLFLFRPRAMLILAVFGWVVGLMVVLHNEATRT